MAVGVPCGKINTVAQALDDPHTAARHMVETVEHPTIGTLRLLGIPFKFSDTACSVRRPPPTLGQHTDEVLSEELGLDGAAIAELRRQEDRVAAAAADTKARFMQRSTDRILTTHTGSLPRPADLVALLNARELGEPYDTAAFDARIRRAISDVVARQIETGIDVVGDGEHSKINWMAYARARLSGPRGDRQPGAVSHRDARLDRVCGGLRRPQDHAYARARARWWRSARCGRARSSAPDRSGTSARTKSAPTSPT